MRLIHVLFVFFTFTACAQKPIIGNVVSVADGDTFTMLINTQQVRVRLYGIDCPEKGQDFSQAAKEFLSSMIAGKMVSVTKKDTDRYGRTIAIVHCDGKNVNEKLLQAGLAWHYKQHDKQVSWAQFEDEARKNRKGLWSLKNPIPPWEFRKNKKRQRVSMLFQPKTSLPSAIVNHLA